ncbi:MAG: SH3 domain-containing protein [Treponema sp.]|nr:SH3 domain-containing protein [Treponema sp.]
MKKPVFCVVIFSVALIAAAQGMNTPLFVAVNTVNVRNSTGFFAGTVGTLNLGEEVTVQQSRGRWLSVRSASGIGGWAPADAFSARRRVGGAGVNVTATEFALAGKGFTRSLEETLRSAGEFDFSPVDALGDAAVSDQDLLAFLRQGRLAEGD